MLNIYTRYFYCLLVKQIKCVHNGRITGDFILLVFLYSSQFYRHKCKCWVHIKIKINIILAQKREFLDFHQDQLAYWEWDKKANRRCDQKSLYQGKWVNCQLKVETPHIQSVSQFILHLKFNTCFLPDTVLGAGNQRQIEVHFLQGTHSIKGKRNTSKTNHCTQNYRI